MGKWVNGSRQGALDIRFYLEGIAVMRERREKRKENEIYRLVMAIGGSFLFALGTNIFIVPMGFYNGGILGAAQLIRTFLEDVFSVEPGSLDLSGIIYYLINIPLFVLAYQAMGKRFLFKSLICTSALTFFLTVIQSPVEPILEDPVAACLIGGIISGAGTGITLRWGASNGGGDILGIYFSKKVQSVSVGKVSMAINLVVYGIMALYCDLAVTIYSIIYIVFLSLALDKVHLQIINVEVQIFTKKDAGELKKQIFDELYRGATTWEARGGYTEEQGTVIYMIVNKYEVPTLRSIVREYDAQAFVTYTENVSVTGNFIKKL